METIGSKRSYALIWCMPNNDDEQETIQPNISSKSKNISGVDHVEQFMQRRNVEVFLPYYSGYTRGAHELLLMHSHSENILVDLVDSTDMNG